MVKIFFIISQKNNSVTQIDCGAMVYLCGGTIKTMYYERD